jgi:hypothetical protein
VNAISSGSGIEIWHGLGAACSLQMEMSSQKLAPEIVPLNRTRFSKKTDTHNSGSNFQVNLILFLLLECNLDAASPTKYMYGRGCDQHVQ